MHSVGIVKTISRNLRDVVMRIGNQLRTVDRGRKLAKGGLEKDKRNV